MPSSIRELRSARRNVSTAKAFQPSTTPHEAAAKLFQSHPHFTIFPGDAVEVMECLNLTELLAREK